LNTVAFGQSSGPNYAPHLVYSSDTGPAQRGYSFSTRGVPTGPNFTPKGSIYDGFDAYAESRMGPETTAWMKASQAVAMSRVLADGIGDRGIYLQTPYGAQMNAEFKPRNAWVGGSNPTSSLEDEIYPKRVDKYLQRPEVPAVYQAQFPEFFNTERVPPMYNPYVEPEVALARHYQGHPTMPIPPQLFGGDDDAQQLAALEDSSGADWAEQERLIFGGEMGWWKWTTSCEEAYAKSTQVCMREHEDGHSIFKGKLKADLPNGNSTIGALDGWTMVKSRNSLLDLRSFQGLEIAIRGDGKTYQMVLGTGIPGYSSVEYVARIPPKATAHKWRVVRIAWDAFVPRFKNGKPAPEAPPMDGAISYVGFAIGDRQWGPFLLEVEYVKALKTPE